MAVKFTSASSQYFETDTRVISGSGAWSMGCWYKVTSVAPLYQVLMDMPDKSGTAYNSALAVFNNGTPYLRFTCRDGGGFSSADATISPTANVWQHALATRGSSTDRKVYLNGGNSAFSGISVADTLIDRYTIGGFGDSTPSSYTNGLIAECAVWHAELTADEARLLGSGVSPLLIRPDQLVSYVPLRDKHDTADVIGRKIKRIPSFNSPTTSRDHPPMLEHYDPNNSLSFSTDPRTAEGGIIRDRYLEVGER